MGLIILVKPVLMNRMSTLMRFIEEIHFIFRLNSPYFSDTSSDNDL